MAVVAVSLIILFAMAQFSSQPDNLGVRNGNLAGCPQSPNCVSTQALDEAHRIDPIPFGGSPAAALASCREVLASMPRSRIVKESGNYLRVEFRSRLFRFVDDVEIYVDPAQHLIQLRSASRLGYSDLGVNRQRMEQFRARFEEASANR